MVGHLVVTFKPTGSFRQLSAQTPVVIKFELTAG